MIRSYIVIICVTRQHVTRNLYTYGFFYHFVTGGLILVTQSLVESNVYLIVGVSYVVHVYSKPYSDPLQAIQTLLQSPLFLHTFTLFKVSLPAYGRFIISKQRSNENSCLNTSRVCK